MKTRCYRLSGLARIRIQSFLVLDDVEPVEDGFDAVLDEEELLVELDPDDDDPPSARAFFL
jgi:hypothetical protein